MTYRYIGISEKELKNKVGDDFFGIYDHTVIKGKIDFAVKPKNSAIQLAESEDYYLWAEAKASVTDPKIMLTQLILTLGRARTFDKLVPPRFLGCFDWEKIAFVPCCDITAVLYQSDFNWKVAPSNHSTREFKLVCELVGGILARKDTYVFRFDADANELRDFIRQHFVSRVEGVCPTGTQVNKNNFKWVYDKWREIVKPTIDVRWELANKSGIIDSDFYLADLLSDNNKTLTEKLFELLSCDSYELDRTIGDSDLLNKKTSDFLDDQKAHREFWSRYARPLKQEYWDYIVHRRDLLVPQDIRERKGSFYTPAVWVQLSQKYIADVLGDDWQDEYVVWDCAAGTGNLLSGLTNPRNVWASTIDRADVDVMRERIRNGANLFDNHLFGFDFLNDNFGKLPKGLLDIINDKEKRRKLIIYINPPYAEADNRKGEGRKGVALSAIHVRYSGRMGYGKREMFVQFLTRVYHEISGCKIAEFSKLKAMQSPRFHAFRHMFRAKLLKCFVVPSDSFDNVNGQFPIGFKIWDTAIPECFSLVEADVFVPGSALRRRKTVRTYDGLRLINDWANTFRHSSSSSIATLIGVSSDFQNQRLVRFGPPHMKVPADCLNWQITVDNLIESSVYYAVRKVIVADWLNDRDQFLYPSDRWQADTVFHNDCLTYAIYARQSSVSSMVSVNHWIPFQEDEIGVTRAFDSSFMKRFVSGLVMPERRMSTALVAPQTAGASTTKALEFSEEAQSVFCAARELWRYYHRNVRDGGDPNASLYDVREYFQGRNNKGKMNTKSADTTYMKLLVCLKEAVQRLARKLKPMVYEYGFLID